LRAINWRGPHHECEKTNWARNWKKKEKKTLDYQRLTFTLYTLMDTLHTICTVLSIDKIFMLTNLP
jgi:hypothetical protein